MYTIQGFSIILEQSTVMILWMSLVELFCVSCFFERLTLSFSLTFIKFQQNCKDWCENFTDQYLNIVYVQRNTITWSKVLQQFTKDEAGCTSLTLSFNVFRCSSLSKCILFLSTGPTSSALDAIGKTVSSSSITRQWSQSLRDRRNLEANEATY